MTFFFSCSIRRWQNLMKKFSFCYRCPTPGRCSKIYIKILFSHRAGTFHEWTIENQSPGGSAKLSKTSLELMLLGVRVKKGNKKARTAVLRTHAPHGFEGVESMQYYGSHPVSKFKIGRSFMMYFWRQRGR